MFTLLLKQSNRQGGASALDLPVPARAVDLPARSFDLARPGVAPQLVQRQTGEDNYRSTVSRRRASSQLIASGGGLV